MQSLRNENKNDMTHDSGCQPEPFGSRSGFKPCFQALASFLPLVGTAIEASQVEVSSAPWGPVYEAKWRPGNKTKSIIPRPIRLEFNSVLPLFLPPVVDSSTLSQYNCLTNNVRTKPERENILTSLIPSISCICSSS